MKKPTTAERLIALFIGWIQNLIEVIITIIHNTVLIVLSAILIKIAWNYMASTFLADYIPVQLQHVSYFQTICAMIVLDWVSDCIQKLTPKFFTK